MSIDNQPVPKGVDKEELVEQEKSQTLNLKLQVVH